MGDYEQAFTHFDESLALYRELGHRNKIAWGCRQLSYVAMRRGQLAQARRFVSESIVLNTEMQQQPGIVNCLAALSACIVARGDMPLAARLCGTVETHLASLHTYLYYLERYEHEKTLALVHATLGPTAFDAAWAEGRALTLERAVALALEEA
jgi:hypothetical protein